ncbi:MAG: citramalate synthase [Desulfobacteraceae bacterium]|jgi:2-isopropylmalate synthase
MEPILIYDTTLRDGTQGENINFSSKEKVKIAKKLDEIGVHYAEGGWPGSNLRDVRFFELAQKENFTHTRITAFGATRKPRIAAADDPNLQALIASKTPAVAIFGKSWPLHVEKIMGNTRDENIAMIRDSISFLKTRDKEAIYDAEHFFDGYKDDPQYASNTLLAAAESGADFLVLCDTNGGTMPFEIQSIIAEVKQFLNDHDCKVQLGIHCHNDCGMAVANSITAVQSGATMVQGTVNGYGERCGNADITSIIPILSFKMGMPTIPEERLSQLKTFSRYVSETANMIPLHSRPFVGKSAFAHKGGIHVNAIMKEPRAYEHMNPALVGNKRRVLVSDMSGKSNVEYKAKEMGVEIGCKGKDCQEIVAEIKSMEDQGYQFDVADGSMKILLEKLTEQFKPHFDLDSFRVSIERDLQNACTSHAIIKIKVDGVDEITAAEGHGPVSALDNALRKALGRFYPDLEAMRLVDFKVRVIDGREGTAARVRVFIESRDNEETWTTIGVSEDIIEASWQALTDSFQFKLGKEQAKKRKK